MAGTSQSALSRVASSAGLAGAAVAVWGASTHVAAQANQTLVIQGGTLIDAVIAGPNAISARPTG